MSVLAADDLAFRDESGGFGNQPEAYVQFRLLPFTEGQSTVKTEVAEPTQNPIWNTTVEVGMVSGEQLMEKTVEVTLWDYRPDKEQVFLGECTVDIQKALLDDRPVWYRLEDPRQLRGSSSTRTSPRTSLVNELTQRLKKENRSLSDRQRYFQFICRCLERVSYCRATNAQDTQILYYNLPCDSLHMTMTAQASCQIALHNQHIVYTRMLRCQCKCAP
ncbi:hypothetical protein LSTR_LSTR016970 [Laodelphax striatellus]|uniref:C2 domain-containing protein n=1 Tax=Laodelphax striatellus TaxID=195883 RepID=A0A482XNZ7_LAOST|nr:hypothetical protein LSTR_LSTR016970 [Laodelphax striatellus]